MSAVSPVRRETATPSARGGRKTRVVARITPEQKAAYKRGAGLAGFRSVSEWLAAVLDREVVILDWRDRGAGAEPDEPLSEDAPTETIEQHPRDLP